MAAPAPPPRDWDAARMAGVVWATAAAVDELLALEWVLANDPADISTRSRLRRLIEERLFFRHLFGRWPRRIFPPPTEGNP